MRPQFSAQDESRLLDDFVEVEDDNYSGTQLSGFCQSYRDLQFGVSLLNEVHSTRWLDAWRGTASDQAQALLLTVRRWTASLFERYVIDDNAFHYLKPRGFLDGLEPPLHLEWNLQSSIRAYSESLQGVYRPITAHIYLRTLHSFNRHQATWPARQAGWPALESRALIVAWIRDQSQRFGPRNAGGFLGVLRNFLEYLRGTGRLGTNPVDLLRERYPLRGLYGLAEAIGSEDPESALEGLARSVARFSSVWGPRMVRFVQLKRSLGVGYDFEERTLAQLDRHLGNQTQGATLSPALIREWLEGLPGVNPRTRDTKRRVAEHFFDYAIRQGHLAVNPARFRSKVRRRRLRPFVFSLEQVREVIDRAARLGDAPFFPHRGATYAAVFVTLYCLGLRISEVCRLSVGDVDLVQGLVLVRKSKFYKSRVLPVGPAYREHLARFLGPRRHRRSTEITPEAPIFAGLRGQRIGRNTIGNVFRTISREMGLRPEPGQRGPCLHSFRHSFARHRLLRWYREGADVQAKLPLLSAYLGHVDIASTQVYLEATPELLAAANVRFEARFGQPAVTEGEVSR